MSAIISACGTYRYRLERPLLGKGPAVAVVMVNPSTADAENDDPTISSLLRIARENGWGRLIVGNLFAYRATDVRELATAADPVGPENDDQLWRIARECEEVVYAWGASGKLPKALRDRWKRVDFLFRAAGRLPLQLGAPCADGHPRHPLYLKATTPLMLWSAPGV